MATASLGEAMSRPELPPEKRKVKRSVTLPKDVVEVGDASGNLSEWLTEAAKARLERENGVKKNKSKEATDG